MSEAEAEADNNLDLELVRACRLESNEENWGRFFEHFGERFRRWIRNTLRDGSAEDREDAYQSLAAELLNGQMLQTIDLTRYPAPYLHRCVRTFAWKYYRQSRRHSSEPLEETRVTDQLGLVADQAFPVSEAELQRRLYAILRSSRISERKLQTFQLLLRDKTLREIADEIGFSTSAVGRYVDELKAFCYEALGVSPPPGKKNLRKGWENRARSG